MIVVKRAYDKDWGDGYAVLVDRLWPRGIRKEDLAIDEWCKTVAPSTELRRWYGHDPDKYAEFARRYRAELADATTELDRLASHSRLILVTASKDVDISQAHVLAEVLANR